MISEVENILKINGYKLTKPRKEILYSIYNSKNHITIEEIYGQLRHLGVGLSTIYRNIEMFKSKGLIKQITIGDINYYEPKISKQKPLYIHLKCTKCGKIIDIENKAIAQKLVEISEEVDGKCNVFVQDINLILSGICENCLRNLENKLT